MGQLRIGINGFGRIGRNVFKIAFERDDVEIVAINDLSDANNLAYLLKHDSNYGSYHRKVELNDGEIIVDDKHVRLLCEQNPESLPWGDLNVDLVIEATGQFTSKGEVEAHIRAGAKKVLLGYHVGSDEISDVIMGFNEDKLDGSDAIIGSAGPGVNSIAALVAIIDGEFGIQKSLFTSISNYTRIQNTVDAPSEDMRDGRSAIGNIIPSTAGVAKALTKAFPHFDGKFDGVRLNVSAPIVSMSDVTMVLGRNTTAEEINEVLKRAAGEPFYQGIFVVSDEPLVSCDYIGNSHSGIVDLSLTRVADGNLAKIMVWYDSTWGYSNRLVELAVDICRSLDK